MIFKKPMITSFFSAALCLTAVGALTTIQPAYAASGTEVKVVVNSNPITTGDIQKRAAFLKVQGKKGNLTKQAREELTEEMLKRVEMKTRGINISKQEIDNAYANFASNNRMTVAQMNQMMNQSGITPEHFKTYIMVQMGWGRLISSRFRQEGMISESEAVQRMLKDGGRKPVATEYHLQQVIFVVPAAKRSAALMAKRRQDANNLRARFNSCDTTRSQAKGILDVTVRDLGRILEPQLPGEWEKDVKATAVGSTTKPQDTDKGVEFLAVCSTRKISDDRVAQLVFSLEGTQSAKGQEEKAEELSKKYVAELRKKARIDNR